MPKTCPRCQGQASDEAAFCPHCGGGLSASDELKASTAPPLPSPPSPTLPASPTATPSYSFDIARWSTADRISGIATLVVLISLFLPWFSVDTFFSVSGLSAHGYLYLVLFLSIALLIYLGARAGWDRLPGNVSIAHAPVMLVASLINLVLVLIAFLFKPSGFSWSVGAWLALIAAIVAAAPIGIPAIQARRAGR